MKYLKTFENYNLNDELLEESWKNWALALGIAASSLVSNSANASSQGLGDKLKDKIESMASSGLTIEKLERDGYSPAPGTLIPSDKKLVDSGIVANGKTIPGATKGIEVKLKSEGIDYNNRKLGFLVYKEVGQGYDVKWISFQ